MKVELKHRHFGVHKAVREVEIAGEFTDYASAQDDVRDQYVIAEDKLLGALPEGFLPVPPRRVLLAVSDEHGGTGQVGLTKFLNWAKYFDAYCLNLVKAEPAPLPEPEGPDPVQIGVGVCRALIQDLDFPVLIETPNRENPLGRVYEPNDAAQLRMKAGDWRVILVPTLDMVSVRAQHGFGFLPELAVLSPGDGQFDKYIFVKYPADRSQITGPEYEAELRAAVRRGGHRGQ